MTNEGFKMKVEQYQLNEFQCELDGAGIVEVLRHAFRAALCGKIQVMPKLNDIGVEFKPNNGVKIYYKTKELVQEPWQ